MSQALGPRPSLAPGGTAGCWAILACCWGLAALAGVVWAAARVTGLVCGGSAEPFGIKFGDDILHGRTTSAWPHTPTLAVVLTAAALAVLAATEHDRAAGPNGCAPATSTRPPT